MVHDYNSLFILTTLCNYLCKCLPLPLSLSLVENNSFVGRKHVTYAGSPESKLPENQLCVTDPYWLEEGLG